MSRNEKGVMRPDPSIQSTDKEPRKNRVSWIIGGLIGFLGVITAYILLINRFDPRDLFIPVTSNVTTAPSLTPGSPFPSSTVQGVPLDAPNHVWLPDADAIPAGLKINVENLGTTNLDVASQFPAATATAVWNDQQSTGRLIGQYRDYINTNLCNIKAGIYELTVQAILHSTTPGAGAALGVDQTFVSLQGIGSAAGYRYTDLQVGCTPAISLRAISLAFARYNVRAYVDITAIPGTMSDSDLLSLATSLAKSMDNKILADSR